MDLIYADEHKKDIGVIPYFDWDLAYGYDENDFELTVSLKRHCCGIGYFLYIDKTEYGGVIDKIEVDTEKEEVTYSGRTWHGILNSKIILPDSILRNNPDPSQIAFYWTAYVASGDANEVLADLIDKLDLSSIFEAETEASNIAIPRYEIQSAVEAYKGILAMLDTYHAKLKFQWNHNTQKVKLWAELSIDHTELDDFDTSQYKFKVAQSKAFTNHVICLGSGEGNFRKTIHIFADETGWIQPYCVDGQGQPVPYNMERTPLKDADYILDTSQQKIYGINEIVDVLDYPDNPELTNYEKLPTKPNDWYAHHEYYFKLDEDGNYTNLEVEEQGKYDLLETQPSDWAVNFKNYYTQELPSGEYVNVKPEQGFVLTTSQPSDWGNKWGTYYEKVGDVYYPLNELVMSGAMVQLSHKPSKWSTEYSSYYYFDGVAYQTISGDSKPYYVPLESKPSNWDQVYGNYYYKTHIWKKKKVKKKDTYYKDKEGWLKADKYFDQKTHEEKTRTKAPKWQLKKYYKQESRQVAPKFVKNQYYKDATTGGRPTWEANKYYKLTNEAPPTFAQNTYYKHVVAKVYTPFEPNMYYKEVIDHYGNMVQDAIDLIEESYANTQSVDIDFDASEYYDILDIVGATDEVTNIAVKQNITKKIVHLTEKKEVISYETTNKSQIY